MSMPWGPAIDAELGYRQQRVRSDFRRFDVRRGQSKRAARSTPRASHRVPVGRSEASAVILPARPVRVA